MLTYAKESIFVALRWSLRQNNDSKLTSKLVKDCFQGNTIALLDWSSQSRDLNSIEHTCGEFKQRTEKLWNFLQKTWYEISVET